MKCILHIGTEKTGTTLIQDWLDSNKKALLDNRVLLPSRMGGKNHYLLPAFFKSNLNNWNKNIIRNFALKNDLEESDEASYKTFFLDSVSEEIVTHYQHCDVAIVTSEHFHRRIRSAYDINSTRNFLLQIFDDVSVVCYFREQFELALSLYSTALKGGAKSTIQEFLKNVVPSNYYYNYLRIADNYATAFGKENCTFKIYDRESFIKNDIRQDFMRSVSETISFDDFQWDKSSSNTSLFGLQAVAYRVINEKVDLWNTDRSVKNEKNLTLKNQVLENAVFRQGKIYSDQSESVRKLFESSNKKLFQKYFSNEQSFKYKKTIDREPLPIVECERSVERVLDLDGDLRDIKNF